MKKDASLVYETYWELLCHFHICAQITELRAEGIKQMSWASYLFQGLRNKTCLVSRRAVSIDEEIEEIIFASVISHTTKSNEDTFKSDTVFESFHHQARISISGRALLEMDRALLAGFLMLWIKRCVVPTLPYEVLIANVVYPTILLSYGRSLSMLPAMVSCVQGGLWVLTKSFCHVETLEDIKGHIIIDQNGPRKLKILYSCVELPYAYLMAWYVMHCSDVSSAGIPWLHAVHSKAWIFKLARWLHGCDSKDNSKAPWTISQACPRFSRSGVQWAIYRPPWSRWFTLYESKNHNCKILLIE